MNHNISRMPGRTPDLEKCNPQTLQNQIDQYFNHCQTADKPPTKNGLVLAIGMNDLRVLNRLEESDSEIAQIIKTANRRLSDWWESRIGGVNQAGGAIFWLKNDGWRDTQEVNVSSLDLYTTPQDASEGPTGQEYDSASALVDS